VSTGCDRYSHAEVCKVFLDDGRHQLSRFVLGRDDHRELNTVSGRVEKLGLVADFLYRKTGFVQKVFGFIVVVLIFGRLLLSHALSPRERSRRSASQGPEASSMRSHRGR
jgi:hypothetical protein